MSRNFQRSKAGKSVPSGDIRQIGSVGRHSVPRSAVAHTAEAEVILPPDSIHGANFPWKPPPLSHGCSNESGYDSDRVPSDGSPGSGGRSTLRLHFTDSSSPARLHDLAGGSSARHHRHSADNLLHVSDSPSRPADSEDDELEAVESPFASENTDTILRQPKTSKQAGSRRSQSPGHREGGRASHSRHDAGSRQTQKSRHRSPPAVPETSEASASTQTSLPWDCNVFIDMSAEQDGVSMESFDMGEERHREGGRLSGEGHHVYHSDTLKKRRSGHHGGSRGSGSHYPEESRSSSPHHSERSSGHSSHHKGVIAYYADDGRGQGHPYLNNRKVESPQYTDLSRGYSSFHLELTGSRNHRQHAGDVSGDPRPSDSTRGRRSPHRSQTRDGHSSHHSEQSGTMKRQRRRPITASDPRPALHGYSGHESASQRVRTPSESRRYRDHSQPRSVARSEPGCGSRSPTPTRRSDPVVPRGHLSAALSHLARHGESETGSVRQKHVSSRPGLGSRHRNLSTSSHDIRLGSGGQLSIPREDGRRSRKPPLQPIFDPRRDKLSALPLDFGHRNTRLAPPPRETERLPPRDTERLARHPPRRSDEHSRYAKSEADSDISNKQFKLLRIKKRSADTLGMSIAMNSSKDYYIAEMDHRGALARWVLIYAYRCRRYIPHG